MKDGMVYLVGAGPGDPGLITLRGIECLKRADVVVYDRLVNRSLLAYARHAELIDVGKQPHRHVVPQAEINSLLIEKAQAGKIVVRLKGGDPFVFGRGGEEAMALAEVGLAFEVIPGVTSAIAAPAYAGIPVTHRGAACSVAFATGHRADFVKDPACDWARLACGPDTLVFLMGVHNLPYIVEQLIAHGHPPDTPVALVERATRTNQKTVTGTLADIVERAAEIRPPAIIIIGEVVKLRESLRWFDLPDRRPLLGLRVLNTRPLPQAGELSWRLMALGAEPVELPTTQVLPVSDSTRLDAVINRLAYTEGNGPAYDWIIFSSVNGVSFFISRIFALGHDVRALAQVKLAAVGHTTVEALLEYGLVADFISTRYTSWNIAAEIGDVTDQRVLLPQSDDPSAALAGALSRHGLAPQGSRPAGVPREGSSPAPEPNGVRARAGRISLAEALRDRGALVEGVAAYAIRPAEADPVALSALLDGGLEVTTFTSSSSLTSLAKMVNNRPLADVLSPLTVACIGPSTADAAHDLGVRVDIVAEEPTIEGLVDTLVKWRTQGRM
jgi:uroporphyrinogen III methyltransferase/synthase